MPRQATEPAMSARRSSRLNGSKTDTERIYKGDSLAVRRSTRSKTSASKPYDRHGGPLSAATASPKDAASRSSASANVRRSLRISPEELVQREAALLAREQEFEAQREALNRATDSLRKQEKENATMMSRLADREGQSVVAQLDGMLCPLCYEVFSAPHTLNVPNCGHTFCGLCILKWFFSRLHGCGTWHEPVHCPICRANIQFPRSENSFPFIPNRLATSAIESLTAKLSTLPAKTTMSVKREANDDVLVESGSKPLQGNTCSGGIPIKVEEDIPSNPDVDGWREGGKLRAEWLKRDSEEKREMNKLLGSWRGLKQCDLLVLKERLGV